MAASPTMRFVSNQQVHKDRQTAMLEEIFKRHREIRTWRFHLISCEHNFRLVRNRTSLQTWPGPDVVCFKAHGEEIAPVRGESAAHVYTG